MPAIIPAIKAAIIHHIFYPHGLKALFGFVDGSYNRQCASNFALPRYQKNLSAFPPVRWAS